MISPSEAKGLDLGLRLLAFDKAKRDTMINGKLVKTSVFARFESPQIVNRNGVGAPRHVLNSYAKSRAGAWRHAIRWLRQLQAGKLR